MLARTSGSGTSPTPCRTTWSRRASRSCARWWATGSGAACTRSRRSPTTGRRARASCSRRAWCSRSSRWSPPASHMVRMGDDGWAIYSQDGSLAAHFEFTVAITAEGPRDPHALARAGRGRRLAIGAGERMDHTSVRLTAGRAALEDRGERHARVVCSATAGRSRHRAGLLPRAGAAGDAVRDAAGNSRAATTTRCCAVSRALGGAEHRPLPRLDRGARRAAPAAPRAGGSSLGGATRLGAPGPRSAGPDADAPPIRRDRPLCYIARSRSGPVDSGRGTRFRGMVAATATVARASPPGLSLKGS